MNKQDHREADQLTESLADLEVTTEHAEQTIGARAIGTHADGDILLVADFTQGP